jgi:hypothetical protein
LKGWSKYSVWQVQRSGAEAHQLLRQPLHRVAIADDDLPETRQIGRPAVSASEASIGHHVRVVARQVARHKQRLVEIWLGNGFDGRSAQRIALHWKVADVVLVQLDFQLLFERLGVETRNLAKDIADLP